MRDLDGLQPDVIVVGAGSAGCALTRRLVDQGIEVLLLEAGGPDDNPAIHDPARFHELWHAAEDWDYYTVAQPHAANRELHWPRGRVLGGSSCLNGLIHVRGARADYEAWVAAGAEGWGWDDVLPAFRAMEDFDGGESELHGVGGPVSILSRYPLAPVHESIIAAAGEAGIERNPDYNGGELDGVSQQQLTIRDGRRDSAAAAYLRPVLGKPSLRVLTGAHARRLLLARGRCVGVEWERDGVMESASAGEVVVCAGAIGSPRLLLLSGIGPADELRELGIAVAADLPGVGRNLHDHLLSPAIFSAERPIAPPGAGQSPIQTHLWWRSRPGLPAPDTQPIHFGVPLYEPWMSGPPNGFTLLGGLVRPASRGAIRLSGPDPEDPLLIDPQVLAEPEDLQALAASVTQVREIGAATALREEWGARELYPGTDVRTSEQLRDYVRRTAITYHHQVGTCRIGDDAEAVVDPRLRVRGIDGLRVADASVMPSVTSGNTNAPSLMIGERAAWFVAAGGDQSRALTSAAARSPDRTAPSM
ncbi:MAG TPA: GMC family oxidoreductase N-terminal domain-containing protein [Gaiellales bacterium]|nr:GMC family oxidoreductase N-terminal domain-containing protein [Gaiellales bacterium]